jgi:hypothetical protein
MKHVSIAALLTALAFSYPALAQDVSVDVSASGDISVSAPDVSVSTDISASGDVSVSTPDVSASVDASASGDISTSSSEMSSSMSSSMSSGAEPSCDDLDASTIVLVPIDAAALAAVTSVTVFSVSECSSLGDLATIDGSALAAIQANAAVTAALQAEGEVGSEIVGYTLDGTSLTVYVQHSS